MEKWCFRMWRRTPMSIDHLSNYSGGGIADLTRFPHVRSSCWRFESSYLAIMPASMQCWLLLSLYFKIKFNVKYVFTLIINGPDHFSFYWLKIGFSLLIFYKEISASYYQVPSCTTATPLPVSFRQTCDILIIYMSFNFSLRACYQGASVRIVNQPSEALGLSGLPCVFPFRYKVGQKLSVLCFEKIFGCS